MKKLKAIHLVNNGEVFQVIGICRIPALVHYDNESDYEPVVLSESTYYHREMNEARALSKANNVQLFDFASERFIEALAKMEKK